MTTPAIMLMLLTGPYLLLELAGRSRGREVLDASTRGCLGITLVFLFTGTGHFVQTEGMVRMLPPWVPAAVPLVYITGVIELAAAIAVLRPRFRRLTGCGLAAMLVGFLPVNIYAAVNRVGMGGHEWGPVYLLIRVPLQLILLWWVWRFAIRSGDPSPELG
jgi:uncharacterized membrane protein